MLDGVEQRADKRNEMKTLPGIVALNGTNFITIYFVALRYIKLHLALSVVRQLSSLLKRFNELREKYVANCRLHKAGNDMGMLSHVTIVK